MACITSNGQHLSLRIAAECVGWEAVQSDLDDDGHWGGFQLRIPEYIRNQGGLHEGAVAAGFGFELCPHEAIEECRRSVLPQTLDDGSVWHAGTDTVTVRLDLLPLLARPIFKAEDRGRKE